MDSQPADMSAGPNAPSQKKNAGSGKSTYAIHRSWKFSLATAIIMVLLAVLGIALTTTNRTFAPTYWIALVPIYGLMCMATASSRAYYEGGGHYLVLRQLLHWLAIAVALSIDFYIRGTGQETGVAAGFNAALLLALGCILAGVHLEWLFSLVGVLLLVALLVVVKSDQYLWLIVIVAVVAVSAMAWLMRFITVNEQRRGAPGSSNSPKP